MLQRLRVDADSPSVEPEELVVEDNVAVGARRTGTRLRRLAMRPRRLLVRLHRWIGIALVAWLVVVSLTGAWLVVSKSTESWLHGERYRAASGDVGPDAAVDAARSRVPDDAMVEYVTLPRNGRGVYQVLVGIPIADAPPAAEGEEAPETYRRVFVDPGTGEVNGVVNDEEGLTWWLYRGHMYLWQDYGIFGVFDADSGWCRKNADGAEPGGAKGIVCDVIPDGGDYVGWFAIGWIAVLLSGFYLWYWPGVRRWATAFVIRRGRGSFALNMSIHKVVGFVVWVPLMVVTFTGAVFVFPNMSKWYENATPAARDFDLWIAPEDAVSTPVDGVDAIGVDRAIEVLEERYPNRAVAGITPPADETGTYVAWVTRGFDPWTREGGAGNVYVVLDQYTGETLYDGTPEDGNVFDQAWDDWSFPLHTGDFGGTTTRVLWVGLAMSPLALAATGIAMNQIRRTKRARRKATIDLRDSAAPVAAVEAMVTP